MRKRYFCGILILILTMSLVLTGFDAGAAEKKFFTIATGGTAGTYYPLGGAIAKLVSDRVKDIVLTAQTAAASVANANLIAKHEVESAFIQADVATWAYTGTEIWKDKPPVKNLRGIASLYPETIQVLALKAAKIKSIKDLKGKRVVPGDAGSGTEVDARIILGAYGITYKDLKNVDYLSFAGATQRMKDNQSDATFVVAGHPTSSVIELTTSAEVDIIPIEEDMIKKLTKDIKFFARTVIPKGTYKGQDKDIATVAVLAQWIVDEKVDADTVYRITKAFWESAPELVKIHAKGKEVTLKTALDGIGVPLHPGAEKYYKEKGLIKK